MFDNYHIRSGPSSIDVKIKEHRAPTDESVRLLREMEADTQKRIMAAFRPSGDIPVTAVIYKRMSTGYGAQDVAHIQVRIAGKLHEVEVVLDPRELWWAEPREIAKVIYDTLLARLAETITFDILPQLGRTR